MKFFSYQTLERQPRIGIEIGNHQYNFTQLWEFFKDITGKHQAPSLIFIQIMVELGFFSYQDITEVLQTVQNLRTIDDLVITESIRFDVPISRPQKILCIGRNYLKHSKESGYDKPEEEPIFFAKMPSTLIPHEERIVLPPDVGRVDHEIELAVVIAKECKNVVPENASECIAGYTIVNDITAREIQKGDLSKKKPWLRSKSMDTFCPIGPYLIPAEAISDPHNLTLTLKVNGEIRQHSNTSNMIFKIPELISYISKFMTLQPGDIIATGTPEGISEIHTGDVVEAEIERIGILKNNVISG